MVATRRRSRARSTRLRFEPIPPPAQWFRGSVRHGRRLAASGAGRSPATTRRLRLPRPFAAWRGCGTHRRTGSSRRPRGSLPMRRLLTIRLRFSWRRFPYALTAVGAAPRFVAGPVQARQRNEAARRRAARGTDVAVPPPRCARSRAGVQAGKAGRGTGAARRHRRDEGRRADRERSQSAHPAWPRSRLRSVRIGYRLQRAYRDTADRVDYEELISELNGSSAYGFLGGEKADPARYRRALDAIPSLPRRCGQDLRSARTGAACRRATAVRTVAGRRTGAAALSRAAAAGASEP